MKLPATHPTSAELLDLAKKNLGIESDYALAKHLRISTSRLANYRHGRSKPDEGMCLMLARLTEYPATYLLALVQSERASNPEARKAWRDSAGEILMMLRTFGGTAAAVILALVAVQFAHVELEAIPAAVQQVASVSTMTREYTLYALLLLTLLFTRRRWQSLRI